MTGRRRMTARSGDGGGSAAGVERVAGARPAEDAHPIGDLVADAESVDHGEDVDEDDTSGDDVYGDDVYGDDVDEDDADEPAEGSGPTASEPWPAERIGTASEPWLADDAGTHDAVSGAGTVGRSRGQGKPHPTRQRRMNQRPTNQPRRNRTQPRPRHLTSPASGMAPCRSGVTSSDRGGRLAGGHLAVGHLDGAVHAPDHGILDEVVALAIAVPVVVIVGVGTAVGPSGAGTGGQDPGASRRGGERRPDRHRAGPQCRGHQGGGAATGLRC